MENAKFDKSCIDFVREEMRFPCDKCDFKTIQKGGLKRDYAANHERIKYPFDLCSSQSNNRH